MASEEGGSSRGRPIDPRAVSTESNYSTCLPNPEPSVPPVNPGISSLPAPPRCERPEYHSLTCSADSNLACVNANSNTKLVQKSPGAPNGCGPTGDGYKKYFTQFLALTASQLRSACNMHDYCFGTCSFGDDAHFEFCNANLLTSSLKICYDNYLIWAV